MNAYIINGYRTAVTRAKKGGFRFTRPDDLAADVIKHLVSQTGIDPKQVDDLVVGNAVPEAEQGMQMGRMIALLSLPMEVPGMIVNRYCGSGIEAISIAAARVHSGMADCIIAGGTESMSMVPIMGYRTALNYNIATKFPEYYTSMGLTAEHIAEEFNISREDQDAYALESHIRAVNAQQEGKFKEEILPITVEETYLDENMKKKTRSFTVSEDEGPRPDTSMEVLSKLKPVFRMGGTVTAGNSSPTNDGAAFVMVVSERFLKENNLKPDARFVNYAAAGVNPRIMGIGPVAAIPKALKNAGLSQNDLDLIELNEAFAAQALAVARELSLDMSTLNVNGGAVALGHPLGCTGAKLSISMINEAKRRGDSKYGMVTACVGGGQGVAGIFEFLH
jgi:acetyl-CoA acyltransferase